MSNHSTDYLQASSSMSVMEKVDERMYITVMMVCQSSKKPAIMGYSASLNSLIFESLNYSLHTRRYVFHNHYLCFLF